MTYGAGRTSSDLAAMSMSHLAAAGTSACHAVADMRRLKKIEPVHRHTLKPRFNVCLAGSRDLLRRPATAAAATIFAALPIMTGGGHAAGKPDPVGVWLIEDARARIRVEKCGASDKDLCGYVVWLKSPLSDDGKPRVDAKNPDSKKRARPSLGHQMMMGLKPVEDDRYEGKVYDSEEGKFVEVSVSMEEADELAIHGCLLKILCGSQTWTRVKDIAPGQLTGPTDGPNGPRADPEWAPRPGHGTSATKG